jgi:acyl-CoA ligase (AMP-forming) (exosortase A-associated)
MSDLLHELIMSSPGRHAGRPALKDGSRQVSYAELALAVEKTAAGLAGVGMRRSTRVGVFLPKSLDTVVAFFGAAMGGGIFVPVNPLLKGPQVAHILEDSGAEILVTSADRLLALEADLPSFAGVRTIVTVDEPPAGIARDRRVVALAELQAGAGRRPQACTIDDDVVSIFYTSGSTGRAKGVVLSHRNMVAGAKSVSSYLGNTSEDSVLAVLPFSFDYGFSQLSTAFHVGARVVLLNYLVPNDVLRAAGRERITGLAGVPPLWIQLAALEWPEAVRSSLRYITNSGGKLPVATIGKLRRHLPGTRVFLMYGLTEAFRSTYLPPELVDERPTSIGKAIPNAEILVVRPDGTECGPNEPGELVHRGALVAQGYWRDPERTAERFRPVPGKLAGVPLTEIAVWSGDLVQRDEEGFLYFVGRNDELIKTSGYRVSPTEVEEALYATHLTSAAVVFGVEHPSLGQSIAAVLEPAPDADGDNTDALLAECRRALPPFMVPATVIWERDLPRNPNGKLDRSGIIRRFRPELERSVAQD